jgi:hypothetical protein
MRIKLFTVCILFGACPLWVVGQIKAKIVDDYIRAFNDRDIAGYLAPLADSVKQIKFPNEIVGKSKSEVRMSYTNAFDAKLGGQITILGRVEIGNIYIIEQSLRREGFQPVDQYILFKFAGDKITEIHYLPKNFSWPRSGIFDK